MALVKAKGNCRRKSIYLLSATRIYFIFLNKVRYRKRELKKVHSRKKRFNYCRSHSKYLKASFTHLKRQHHVLFYFFSSLATALIRFYSGWHLLSKIQKGAHFHSSVICMMIAPTLMMRLCLFMTKGALLNDYHHFFLFDFLFRSLDRLTDRAQR